MSATSNVSRATVPLPGKSYRASFLRAGGACDFGVKARQDRLEEGVLDDPYKRPQRAHLWIVGPTDHLGLGGDLFAPAVLENLGDAADDVLVHLLYGRLVLVLLLAVDLQILEERLDVPGDDAVLRIELGIEAETSGRRVEAAVRAKQIVQPRDVHLFDTHAHVEARTGLVGAKRRIGAGRAAAHERPSELGDGRALDLLIAQVRQRPVGIGQKHMVRGVGRLVYVADRASPEPQLVDTHQQPRSITRLLRGLGGVRACRLLGGRRRRRVDVV